MTCPQDATPVGQLHDVGVLRQGVRARTLEARPKER